MKAAAAALFEKEFIAALKLLDRASSAGSSRAATPARPAIPQFMPSVALRLRADGDGDGYADIWRNEDDAFASIANYLRDAGWKPNLPWGVRGAHAADAQPGRDPVEAQRAALRRGVPAPQPLADGGASGGRWA